VCVRVSLVGGNLLFPGVHEVWERNSRAKDRLGPAVLESIWVAAPAFREAGLGISNSKRDSAP
jgi:hypothetical protein